MEKTRGEGRRPEAEAEGAENGCVLGLLESQTQKWKGLRDLVSLPIMSQSRKMTREEKRLAQGPMANPSLTTDGAQLRGAVGGARRGGQLEHGQHSCGSSHTSSRDALSGKGREELQRTVWDQHQSPPAGSNVGDESAHASRRLQVHDSGWKGPTSSEQEWSSETPHVAAASPQGGEKHGK